MKPHHYTGSPLSYPRCECGESVNSRLHQPWWWRPLNPGKNWRT